MIRNIIATAAIALCAYVSTASAQLPADSRSDTVSAVNDSVETVNATDTVDNMTANKDSTGKANIDAINLDDEELLQAALAADSARVTPSTQKLDLIRRDYEYKRQTRAAVIMMVFIAIAMATSQSWNPR